MHALSSRISVPGRCLWSHPRSASLDRALHLVSLVVAPTAVRWIPQPRSFASQKFSTQPPLDGGFSSVKGDQHTKPSRRKAGTPRLPRASAPQPDRRNPANLSSIQLTKTWVEPIEIEDAVTTPFRLGSSPKGAGGFQRDNPFRLRSTSDKLSQPPDASLASDETSAAVKHPVDPACFPAPVLPAQAETGAGTDKGKALTPQEMVAFLDRYIVGQDDAKRTVATALRNRWRRQQLTDPRLRSDIIPPNILLVGPTGVGKTEIARRLSQLVDAPFLKVEATKFTEVGFHGKDVEQIIKDLVEVSVKRERNRLDINLRQRATKTAHETILNALLGRMATPYDRQHWLKHLEEGRLDDRLVAIEFTAPAASLQDSFLGDLASSDSLLSNNLLKPPPPVKIRSRGDRTMMTVSNAREQIVQSELEKGVSDAFVSRRAVESVEQEGIIFLDEIDKICTSSGKTYAGPDASAEGVQRDLLPIIEGSTIATRYGNVKTDQILFIASGAFHSVKPSDMLAELRGRLPIRVDLSPLNEQHLRDILTVPKFNILRQKEALLKADGVHVEFTEPAVEAIAHAAAQINVYLENIGARRLHTIVEHLMRDISFNAPDMPPGTAIPITEEDVRASVAPMLIKNDLHRHVI